MIEVVRAEGRPQRPEASGEMIEVVRAKGRPRPEASGEMIEDRSPH
jgi:hypothetical protein